MVSELFLLTCELLPGLVKDVIHESFSGHRVLASVTGRTTEQHHLCLAHDRDCVSEASLGNLTVNFECLDDLALGATGGARAVVAGGICERVSAIHYGVGGSRTWGAVASPLLLAKGDRHGRLLSSTGGTALRGRCLRIACCWSLNSALSFGILSRFLSHFLYLSFQIF